MYMTKHIIYAECLPAVPNDARANMLTLLSILQSRITAIVFMTCGIISSFVFQQLTAQPVSQSELDRRIIERIKEIEGIETIVFGEHLNNSSYCFAHIESKGLLHASEVDVRNYFVGYRQDGRHEYYYFEPRPIAITENHEQWEAVSEGRLRPYLRGKGALIRCTFDPSQMTVLELTVSPQ